MSVLSICVFFCTVISTYKGNMHGSFINSYLLYIKQNVSNLMLFYMLLFQFCYALCLFMSFVDRSLLWLILATMGCLCGPPWQIWRVWWSRAGIQIWVMSPLVGEACHSVVYGLGSSIIIPPPTVTSVPHKLPQTNYCCCTLLPPQEMSLPVFWSLLLFLSLLW